jgi:periplasmic protein CpxP/Spy
MNRTKLLTIAVIGLLFLNLGTLGILFFSRPPHPPMPPEMRGGQRGEGPKQIMIERLHLDAIQQKAYELLITDHRTQTNDLREASQKMHDQLFSLLKETSENKIQTDSIITEIANNQKAIEHLNFDHFNAIKNLCKGTQLDDFNALAEELGNLFSPKPPPRP